MIRHARARVAVLLACARLALGAVPAVAEERGPADADPKPAPAHVKSYEGTRERPQIYPEPLPPGGEPNAYDRFKTRLHATGLDYDVLYSAVSFWGSQPGPDNRHASGAFDLIANWAPFKGLKSRLSIYVSESHRYAGVSNEDFAARGVGSVMISSDTDDAAIGLRTAVWEQYLLDDTLKITAGQLDPALTVDFNTYASDDRAMFSGGMLARNITSTLPEAGLGAIVTLQLQPWWSVSAGFHDANGNGRYPDVTTFRKGQYAYYGNLTLLPRFPFGGGIYSFTYYGVAGTERNAPSQGLSLSVEQPIHDEVALVLRVGYAHDQAEPLDVGFGAGVVWLRPFGRTRDRVGLGVSLARPSDRSLRGESMVEAWYYARVWKYVEVGPMLQLFIHPAQKPDRDGVFVGGLRARALF